MTAIKIQKRLLLRLVNIHESCAHDASTTLLLYIPQLTRSIVISDVSEAAPEQRTSPLISEQDRACVSMRWSRGASNTVQLWLFSLAAAPTWSGGMSWTGQLPPEATRTYPAEFQTSSTASALRCAAVVLDGVKMIHFANTNVNYQITAADKLTFLYYSAKRWTKQH